MLTCSQLIYLYFLFKHYEFLYTGYKGISAIIQLKNSFKVGREEYRQEYREEEWEIVEN